MKIRELRKGDKLMYMVDEQQVGAYYKGQISTVYKIDDGDIAINNGGVGIPFSNAVKNYKFVKENGELEDLTMSLTEIEFIAKARFFAWICYQMGAGQSYNIEPTKDQLDSLKQGVLFGLLRPNSTPEENHKNWMEQKISQGWIYGKIKDMDKKTHPDLVPFDKLPKIEKDKDIMDCLMNKKFNELWQEIFK